MNSPLGRDNSFALSDPIVFANEPAEQSYLETTHDGIFETHGSELRGQRAVTEGKGLQSASRREQWV